MIIFIHSNVLCYLVESHPNPNPNPNPNPGMTYAVATTLERVRTDKSNHCACTHMRDMRLDEFWTGRVWDHHSGFELVVHSMYYET